MTPLAPAHLRVLPIPDSAPPVLPPGDPTRAGAYVQGTLAVDFRTSVGPDQSLNAPVARPRHGRRAGGADVDPVFGPQPTATADLPDLHDFAETLVQALVETMTGARSPAQLRRWTSDPVYQMLVRRSTLAKRRGAGPSRRAVVRRVRVCEPADGVAEACAVVLEAGRARAVALRLVGLDGRWVLTALQIG